MLDYSQVREARTSLFNAIAGCFACIFMILELLQVRTVVAIDNLAQVSLSRLGEVSIGSPRPSRANGHLGNPLSFEQASVSPKRERA